MTACAYTTCESPLGPILLAGSAQGLTCISFLAGRESRQPQPDWVEDPRPLHEAVRQLQAYFDGRLFHFDLPLAAPGTPFQHQVWQALREIPYGQTTSYGELARRLGRPSASRAVGAANGRNPLPIVVPCHRVIGGNGALRGYYGGLQLKEFLLELERFHAPRPQGQLALV